VLEQLVVHHLAGCQIHPRGRRRLTRGRLSRFVLTTTGGGGGHHIINRLLALEAAGRGFFSLPFGEQPLERLILGGQRRNFSLLLVLVEDTFITGPSSTPSVITGPRSRTSAPDFHEH
jgi:hypothetical protein